MHTLAGHQRTRLCRQKVHTLGSPVLSVKSMHTRLSRFCGRLRKSAYTRQTPGTEPQPPKSAYTRQPRFVCKKYVYKAAADCEKVHTLAGHPPAVLRAKSMHTRLHPPAAVKPARQQALPADLGAYFFKSSRQATRPDAARPHGLPSFCILFCICSASFICSFFCFSFAYLLGAYFFGAYFSAFLFAFVGREAAVCTPARQQAKSPQSRINKGFERFYIFKNIFKKF